MNDYVYEWLQSIGLQISQEEMHQYEDVFVKCYHAINSRSKKIEYAGYLYLCQSKLIELIQRHNPKKFKYKSIESLLNNNSFWNTHKQEAKEISKLVYRSLHQQTYKQNVDKWGVPKLSLQPYNT